MSTYSPKSEALRALYWRSEILRLMYWLRGEGLGDVVDVPTLERYLDVEAHVGLTYLDRLVEDGLLVRDGELYALSETGRAEGEEEYLSAFSDLLQPASGACSPECWCQISEEEAVACSAQRAKRQRYQRHQQERKTPRR